jgi:uncharacterized Zn ribbon protein
VLKRGTVIRNIHLADYEDAIEGRADEVKRTRIQPARFKQRL